MLEKSFQSYQALLAQGATAMGCELSPKQQQQLLDYLVLLEKWNQTHNVVQQLGLNNVTVVHSRVEQLSQTSSFDVIMARAVGTLVNLLQWTQPLLKPQGCWVLMKGLYPQQELQEITMPNKTIKLSVPGVDAQRHVVVIKNTG